MHVIEWTKFLKEETPLSLFQDIAQEPADRIKERPELLDSLFRVAEMEEEYLCDARGWCGTMLRPKRLC